MSNRAVVLTVVGVLNVITTLLNPEYWIAIGVVSGLMAGFIINVVMKDEVNSGI